MLCLINNLRIILAKILHIYANHEDFTSVNSKLTQSARVLLCYTWLL